MIGVSGASARDDGVTGVSISTMSFSPVPDTTMPSPLDFQETSGLLRERAK